MIVPDWLLVDVAVAEAALLVAGWLALLGAGVRRSVGRARHKRVLAARDAITSGLLEGELTPAQWALVRALGRRQRVEVFTAIAPNLRGRERAWLSGLAERLGLVAHGERLCRSRLWWRRLAGARLLTLAGAAGDTVLGLAHDPHPLVRGQVAEWCGRTPTPAAIRTLVEMLGDPDRASRFAVQDALVRVGEPAVEPLRDRLSELDARLGDPLEARSGLAVARGLGDGRLSDPALALSHHGDPMVRRGAYRALGMTGGAEAAARLEAALEDRFAPARAAAAEALGVMGHWPAARRLAGSLGDPSWDVRSAAGQALIRLGPPGELLLRRASRSDDRFVADMAHHVLDTAAVVSGRP